MNDEDFSDFYQRQTIRYLFTATKLVLLALGLVISIPTLEAQEIGNET